MTAPLPNRDAILVVLLEIDRPATREDIVVAAWHAYPMRFGLRHYEATYPNADAVYVRMYGERGLVYRGYVRREGKCFVLTAAGRARAGRLRGR